MPIIAPLDRIPQLPGKAVDIINKLAQKQIDIIIKKIMDVIADAMNLPDGIPCDDPRIDDIKEKLAKIMEMITKVQEMIPIIQQIIGGIKTLVGIAKAVKAATLIGPQAPIILAGELVTVQNMTIANATVALQQLSSLPPYALAQLESAAYGLAGAVNVLGNACNGEDINVAGGIASSLGDSINDSDYSDSIPNYPGGDGTGRWIMISGSGNCINPSPGRPPNPPSPHTDTAGCVWFWTGGGYENPDGISWGSAQSRVDDATIGTEFYTETNVSIDDIRQRAKVIADLVEDQQDLLKSLQEAPAQSYNGTDPPAKDTGKIGDYYVDTYRKIMYGPMEKPKYYDNSQTTSNNHGWGDGIKY